MPPALACCKHRAKLITSGERDFNRTTQVTGMRKMARRQAAQLFSQSQDIVTPAIAAAELAHLPEPAQRYLRYTGILGQARIQTVRLKQAGSFRMQPNQAWMPLVAEQYYTVNPPAFLWFGTIKPWPLLSISAIDQFSNGHGSLLVKLLSLVTLTNAQGAEVDQGELLRYLGEMIWFPTGWLSDYIQWQAIDHQSAQVTLTDHGLTVSAILHFNADGQMIKFTSDRPYEGRLEKWTALCSEYKQINGLQIPTKAEVMWNLRSGDFSYFRGEIVEIAYNQPVAFRS
jgi:hypothetical protein